jgi:hypothetical protein
LPQAYDQDFQIYKKKKEGLFMKYLIFWIAVTLIVGIPAILSLVGNLKEILSERNQKKLNETHRAPRV